MGSGKSNTALEQAADSTNSYLSHVLPNLIKIFFTEREHLVVLYDLPVFVEVQSGLRIARNFTGSVDIFSHRELDVFKTGQKVRSAILFF